MQVANKLSFPFQEDNAPVPSFLNQLHKLTDTSSILKSLWQCLDELGFLGFGYFRFASDLQALEYGDSSGPTNEIRTSNNQYSMIFKRFKDNHFTERFAINSNTGSGCYIVCPVYGPYYRNGIFIVRSALDPSSFHEEGLCPLDTMLTKAHIASAYYEASLKEKNLSFSAREIDVLMKIIKGLSNKEIGMSLGISAHTVNGYVRRILLKTGENDRLSACLVGSSIPVIGNKILSEAIHIHTT